MLLLDINQYQFLCCGVVYSQSETVHAVGECVWAHYLTVTEKAGRDGASSLSAAQRQEVWVQYSALQIALQVSSHLQALVSVCTTTRSSRPHVVLVSSSGLSSESKEPPERHFHLRTITHASVSHIFFSGTVLLLLGFDFLSPFLSYGSHTVFFSRLTVTQTRTANPCPWSPPS